MYPKHYTNQIGFQIVIFVKYENSNQTLMYLDTESLWETMQKFAKFKRICRDNIPPNRKYILKVI